MHSILHLEKVYKFAVIAVMLSSFSHSTGQSAHFRLWISTFLVTELSTGLSAMSSMYSYVVMTAKLSTGFEHLFDYGMVSTTALPSSRTRCWQISLLCVAVV